MQIFQIVSAPLVWIAELPRDSTCRCDTNDITGYFVNACQGHKYRTYG